MIASRGRVRVERTLNASSESTRARSSIARSRIASRVAIYYTILCYTVIGASLSEPHTNRYYEKIAIVMYVCVCVCECVCVSAIRRPRVVLVHVRASVRTYVWLTSARTRAPILTVTFNVNDHFYLKMIVNINVIIL